MSIRTLNSTQLLGMTASLVEVTDPDSGAVESVDYELACDACDYFATHLSWDDVGIELAVHEHVYANPPDERADAILADHAAGLHEPVDVDGCRYPGCDDAFWRFARAQESRLT